MCHGDAAQYNTVVKDGVAVGFIDFDAAHPGPRVWDVVYAVYRFAPLQGPDNPESFGTPREQGRRVPPSAGRTGWAGAPRSSTSSPTGCGLSSTSCATRPRRATRRSSYTLRSLENEAAFGGCHEVGFADAAEIPGMFEPSSRWLSRPACRLRCRGVRR
jgi:hypothetical protein